MAIGPVQLIVLGFNHPDFHGEVIAELERLRASDTVRVIDSLAVYKDADGELEVEHLSNLTEAEAIELGSKIGALIGLGIEGEEGAEAGAIAGAEEVAAEGGVNVFTEEEAWDVLADIPNDSAAALILIEHHWAVPLRDAVVRAGGFRISDAFISPLDLVELGLVSSDEAQQLHELETQRPQPVPHDLEPRKTPRNPSDHENTEVRYVRRTQSSPAHRAAHRPACFPPQVTPHAGAGSSVAPLD